MKGAEHFIGPVRDESLIGVNIMIRTIFAKREGY